MYKRIFDELNSYTEKVRTDNRFGDIERKQVAQGLMIAYMIIQDIEEVAKVYEPQESFFEIVKEYDGYLDKEDMRHIVKFAYEPEYSDKLDNMIEHKEGYDLLSMIYKNDYTVTNYVKDKVEELFKGEE